MQPDLARILGRLGGVFQQVQKHLQQLVTVGPDMGQRRVVIFDKQHMRAKADHRRAPRAVQHIVDIHRL